MGRCTHLAPGGTEGKVILGTGCLIRLAREDGVRRGSARERSGGTLFPDRGTHARSIIDRNNIGIVPFPSRGAGFRGNRVGLNFETLSPRPWNIAPSFRESPNPSRRRIVQRSSKGPIAIFDKFNSPVTRENLRLQSREKGFRGSRLSSIFKYQR